MSVVFELIALMPFEPENIRLLNWLSCGEIVVVGVGSKYVELGRSKLEEGVMATPALNEDAIFIRTDKTLLKFNLEEEK